MLIDAAGATAELTIDLAALRANWRRLADKVAPAECAAVIKADGYGVGLEPAMRALLAAGCRTFFVARASEGVRARAVSSQATVYVLDGLVPGARAILSAHGLRPALGSLEEIADILEVLQGLVEQVHGVKWEEVRVIQGRKWEERGGFAQGIILERVEEGILRPSGPTGRNLAASPATGLPVRLEAILSTFVPDDSPAFGGP